MATEGSVLDRLDTDGRGGKARIPEFTGLDDHDDDDYVDYGTDNAQLEANGFKVVEVGGQRTVAIQIAGQSRAMGLLERIAPDPRRRIFAIPMGYISTQREVLPFNTPLMGPQPETA